MESIIRDVVFAFRSLRRQPAFAITAVLTIALGIGATTAIFSVVNAVLLRPLPYNEAARLGTMWNDMRNRNVVDFPIAPGDFFDLQTAADAVRRHRRAQHLPADDRRRRPGRFRAGRRRRRHHQPLHPPRPPHPSRPQLRRRRRHAAGGAAAGRSRCRRRAPRRRRCRTSRSSATSSGSAATAATHRSSASRSNSATAAPTSSACWRPVRAALSSGHQRRSASRHHRRQSRQLRDGIAQQRLPARHRQAEARRVVRAGAVGARSPVGRPALALPDQADGELQPSASSRCTTTWSPT